MSKEPDDDPPTDTDDAYTLRLTGYIERSLLIILGGTTTVLAGFLSQIWGSAGIPFRSELAESLQRLGVLFTSSFALPALRFYAEWPNRTFTRRRKIATLVWMIGVFTAFGLYGRVMDQLGDTILKFSKLPSP